MGDNTGKGKGKRVNFAGETPGANENAKEFYQPGAAVSDSVATRDLNPHILPEEHFADDGGYFKRVFDYFSEVKKNIGKTISDRLHEVPATRFAQSPAAVKKSDAAKVRRTRYDPTERELRRIKKAREYSDRISPEYMFEDAVLTTIPLKIPPEFLEPTKLLWASQGRLRYSQEEPADYAEWIRKYPFYIKSYDKELDDYVKSLSGHSTTIPTQFHLETIFWFNYEFAEKMAVEQAAKRAKHSGGKLRRSKRKLSKRSKKTRKNKNTK